MDMKFEVLAISAGSLLVLALFIVFITRYKRCRSDQLLVIYGHIGNVPSGSKYKIIQGGAAIVFPVVQDYAYLDLTPMEISFSKEIYERNSIPVSMTFEISFGITTVPAYLDNAAERLIGQSHEEIKQVANEIIIGGIRSVSLRMSIVEIVGNKQAFVNHVEKAIQWDFDKLGLKLLNINLKQISSFDDIVSNVNSSIKDLSNKSEYQDEVEKRLVEINDKLSELNLAKAKLIEEQVKLFHALNKTR